jgi:ELWxxDGT repeat protein/VCBS repeat-containing protein
VLGNGKALFAAGDGINGCELWITDGTTAGTMLFKDIYAGTSSSYPDQITALGNGKVLFRADDGINGFELWVTDGTAAGTMLLEDIYAGANSSGPRNFIVLGDVNTRPTLSAASATAILTEAGGIANSTTGTAASSITLTKSDVDVGDSASYDTIYLTTNGWISSDSGLIYAKTGTYGTAILTLATDTISYTLNDNAPATQALTRDAPAEAVVLQGSDSFTVQIIDTHGATASTNVVFNINGSNDAPVIGGATAVIYINDNATVTPFSNLTITDPDTGAMAIVTITLDNASKGVFTTASLTASGFSTSNGGLTYAQAASTPDALQAAIRSLVYQPTPNHVAPNSTETTTFTVSVSDGLAAPVSASTTVISTSINNAPVIGITSVTTINDTATATPFSSLTITDPDISALETVTITLDNANKGVFTAASLTASGFGTNDGGLTYIHAADTPAALQAAIRSLVYKPTINHVLPNSTESTFLQLVSVMVLRQPLSMQIPKLSQLQ